MTIEEERPISEDSDRIATDAKSVLGPAYRAAREREAEPEQERHPELVGLVHLLVTEWTAATAPEDGIIGHPVVLEDGTLNEAAAECDECRTRFEAYRRGEPVERPTGERWESWKEPIGDPSWLCPFHGKGTVKISDKTGRAYRGCPDCGSFSRPGETLPRALLPPKRALTALADAVYARMREEWEQPATPPELQSDWRPRVKPTGAAALVAAGVHLHGSGRCDYGSRGRCVYPGMLRLAFSDWDQLPSPGHPRVLSKGAAVAVAVAAGIHLHGLGDCTDADGDDECSRPGLFESAFSDFR